MSNQINPAAFLVHRRGCDGSSDWVSIGSVPPDGSALDETDDLVPLYNQEALDNAVKNALDERMAVHTESSRIYARLASAVRAGADDATLARLLRHEVSARA